MNNEQDSGADEVVRLSEDTAGRCRAQGGNTSDVDLDKLHAKLRGQVARDERVSVADIDALYALARLAAPTQASTAQAEEVVRFCPHCASIGDIGEEYRDCCPDGSAARRIPKPLAEVCRDTFKLAISAAPAIPSQSDLTPLDYRMQGREEALAIILAQDPEEPFANCTSDHSIADAGDYSTEWNEVALRDLLHIGDRKHDAYDRAEAAYWEALGHKEEAERMKRTVERAPFFKPLNDYLAARQEWGLLHLLQEAAAIPSQGKADSLNEGVGGWISVDERPPEDGKWVQIFGQKWTSGHYQAVAKHCAGEFFDHHDEEQGEYINVTHWMPLPPAPGAGDTGEQANAD